MGDTDKQFNAKLIDDYYVFRDLRRLAIKANADDVVKAIEEQMERIRLKLLPLELPKESD